MPGLETVLQRSWPRQVWQGSSARGCDLPLMLRPVAGAAQAPRQNPGRSTQAVSAAADDNLLRMMIAGPGIPGAAGPLRPNPSYSTLVALPGSGIMMTAAASAGESDYTAGDGPVPGLP